MRRADIERHIRQQNKNAEREAELNRVKAQLWSRIAAAMREIQGMAENEPSRHRATIPAKLLPKGIDGTRP
jgi:hypothetical protein